MLRVCVIDFQGGWSQHLLMAEFAYNNSYQASIKMAPFEALYGRKCRSPLHWSEVGERLALGPDMLQEAEDKVRIARERLLTAQSRQKSYVDKRRRDLEFQIGDHVFLKVSPTRGIRRFGIRGKLSPDSLDRMSRAEDDLSFEEQPLRILAREVKRLWNREIPYVKALCSNHDEREATWELESALRERYPHLF
uniref:Integrase catalytic domain-containing protein n=1 Tax=Ananas comosus var. bracteatus TaxID=296719 RepID=A0A6V7NST8_ANACO|nr:unnamed protein product [Ananas comosus var. bracteatus]